MSEQNKDDQNFYNEDIIDSSTDGADFIDTESSDDWVDDGEGEFEGEPIEENPPKKKKSMVTTILIIAVAVIGVLGFMMMKGGGNKDMQAGSENPVAADDLSSLREGGDMSISAQQNAAAPIPAPTTATIPAPAAPQGLMDDPSLLNEPTTEAAPALPDAPMTAPSAPADTMAEPATLTDTIAPDIKPVSDFPTVDSIKKPATDKVDTAIGSEQPVTADESPDAAPETTMAAPTSDEDTSDYKLLQGQLADKDAKIEELKKSLEAANAALEAQKSKVVTPPATDADQVSTLKSKIADLEDRLEKAQQPEPAAPLEQEKPAKEKTVTTKAASEAPVVAAQTEVKAANWVLKSARPGRAVLVNSGTRDYKTVVVGDNIPGLGKILSISETPIGWTVVGTSKTIKE